MGLLAEDVTIVYEGLQSRRVVACWNVNFTVETGEFVCLVGPSGCGKTTLLHAIDGLVPVTSGRLTVDRRPVAGPGQERAMVFQQAALFPWRTVLRNVTFGLEVRGVGAREAAERAMRMLEMVGLADFADRFTSELSGGMQQRVNLARALCVDPKVLLLDEPFAALDAQTREVMQNELLRIWSRSQTTALFVTHDIGEAVFLADRVIVFTPRPARVKEIFDVDLPRPRDLSVKRQPRFLELADRIWSAIELPELARHA